MSSWSTSSPRRSPRPSASVRVRIPTWVNEPEKAGLTPLPSRIVNPPRVAESPGSLECKAQLIVDLGSHNLATGEVVMFHIRDDPHHNGTAHVNKLRHISLAVQKLVVFIINGNKAAGFFISGNRNRFNGGLDKEKIGQGSVACYLLYLIDR